MPFGSLILAAVAPTRCLDGHRRRERAGGGKMHAGAKVWVDEAAGIADKAEVGPRIRRRAVRPVRRCLDIGHKLGVGQALADVRRERHAVLVEVHHGRRPLRGLVRKGQVLADHDTDGHGAVVQGNRPAPAAAVRQGLEEWGAFHPRTRGVGLAPLPVAPGCGILERLVVFAVLEVLCGDQAVAPTGVDDIVTFDGALGAVGLA